MSPKSANDKKLIAFVESDPKTQLIMLDALKRVGASNPILIFNDGEEILEHFFSKGGYTGRRVPGLLMMSCRENMEILERFKQDKQLRQVPILIIGDKENCPPTIETYQKGAASMISKSQVPDLEAAAEVLADYWLTVCRLPGD